MSDREQVSSNEKVSVIEALRLLRALTREVDAPIERAAVDLLESEIDRLRDVEALTRTTHEPPAVDVAPIAKLTVRDGLVQRAGLYAPGLPDGDHDVFPVPLSPKGELRPHVLAEPPNAVDSCADPEAPCASHMALQQAEAVLRICARYLANRNAGNPHGFNAACLAIERYFEVQAVGDLARDAETKDAGECGACDKPGEHCANVHGICSRHGGRAHETNDRLEMFFNPDGDGDPRDD